MFDCEAIEFAQRFGRPICLVGCEFHITRVRSLFGIVLRLLQCGWSSLRCCAAARPLLYTTIRCSLGATPSTNVNRVG
eukprot:4048051-Pyramimonas_sp.AAC.2